MWSQLLSQYKEGHKRQIKFTGVPSRGESAHANGLLPSYSMVIMSNMGTAVRVREQRIGGQELLVERDKTWFLTSCVMIQVWSFLPESINIMGP